MKRILIVDDSATARMFTKRCLEIVGYQNAEFVELSNGKEALKVLKRDNADLIITDLNMPEMDGEELLRRIASSPKYNSTPVVVITSTKNQAKKDRLQELGVAGILGKPISPQMMSDLVGKLQTYTGE